MGGGRLQEIRACCCLWQRRRVCAPVGVAAGTHRRAPLPPQVCVHGARPRHQPQRLRLPRALLPHREPPRAGEPAPPHRGGGVAGVPGVSFVSVPSPPPAHPPCAHAQLALARGALAPLECVTPCTLKGSPAHSLHRAAPPPHPGPHPRQVHGDRGLCRPPGPQPRQPALLLGLPRAGGAHDAAGGGRRRRRGGAQRAAGAARVGRCARLLPWCLPPAPCLRHAPPCRHSLRPTTASSPLPPVPAPPLHAQQLVISNLVRVNTVITQKISQQDEDRTTEFL
jgi:hypothetical protein